MNGLSQPERDEARSEALERIQRRVEGGLSYQHLLGVVNATEPLLDTDAVALGELLGVPASWLRYGWSQHTTDVAS